MSDSTGSTKSTAGESQSILQEDILNECLTTYESIMEPHFYAAKSTPEFQMNHTATQEQVVKDIPKQLIGNKQNDIEDMTRRFIQESNKIFKELKKQFQAAQKRDQNKLMALGAQRDALNLYDANMEKLTRNNPHLNTKDVNKHHENFLALAIQTAKEKGGIAMTPLLLTELRNEVEQRRIFFADLAKINSISINDPAIGIDLGTTMCCVAVYYQGSVKIIPNRAQGNSNTTPSYVSYRENGHDAIGTVAKEEAYMYPETTIFDAKRMIGRPWNDERLQNDRKHWPFEVINDLGNPKVSTLGRTRYPHEVSAKLLHSLRLMADDYLEKPRGTTRKAVITVPAYFEEPQRRATNEAAMVAGLEVLNILNEPTAAAVAYNFQKRNSGKRNILIYDLGGGTFDVSIAKVDGDDIKVLTVDGDTHLGGHDFDQLLVDYCIKIFLVKEGVNLEEGKNSPQKFIRDDVCSALSRLRLQCERVKERLSSTEQSKVEVPRICGRKNLIVPISRNKMNELVKPLVRKTLDIVSRAFEENSVKKAGIESKADIHDVILVGGSTRMPLVIEMLKEFFNGQELSQYVNPDEAVAYGAALKAAYMNKAQGLKSMKIQDVTPKSLGIEVKGERFSRIIPKNSAIPCTFDEIYQTSSHMQTSCDIVIFQGEEPKPKDNKWLGNFTLGGFIPKPAGEEKCRVTMTINENGILEVDAVTLSTKCTNAITISSERLGMDKETIDRLREEFKTQDYLLLF